jgi:hypothetical protein
VTLSAPRVTVRVTPRVHIWYPPFVMDFDHVSGDKIDDICNLRRKTANWWKILEEIEKCDLVCANCHRARTHYRRLGQVPPMAILAQAFGDCVVIGVPSV